jgi:cation diffusion facilitator CzcD-associated flavoprotein CzcO
MADPNAAPVVTPRPLPSGEHVDVLIVGAGLSGIGAACAVQARCPSRTFAILEARHALGGTWDLFRYPGIRSDSDMYTLGYGFRPWRGGEAITDGESILGYIRETAREHGVDGAVRFGHRVTRAAWSSAEARWTVEAETGPGGGTVRITCGFLYLCTGYYDYAEGHRPTGRASTGSAAGSSTRSTGRRISTTRASRWSSSGAAPPRSRSCPSWRSGPPM